jgi:hypothetical protein
LREWITDILLHGTKKIWEYLLVGTALFTVYLLTFTDCGERITDKFRFATDVKDEVTKQIDNLELPNGLKAIR